MFYVLAVYVGMVIGQLIQGQNSIWQALIIPVYLPFYLLTLLISR